MPLQKKYLHATIFVVHYRCRSEGRTIDRLGGDPVGRFSKRQASPFTEAPSFTQGFLLSGFLFGAVRPQSGDTVSCPQLLYMWDANVRAVRNRMRYVRDGAAELDWVSARTEQNMDQVVWPTKYKALWKMNSTSAGQWA